LTLVRQSGAISAEEFGETTGRMTSESKLRILSGLAFALAFAVGVTKVHAQDDWQAVGTTTLEDRSNSRSSSPLDSAGPSGHAETAAGRTPGLVCGEAVRPASARIQSMVTRINALWGSDLRVYETVAPEPPHAAPGGCIFYNSRAMAAIMAGRLDVNDPSVVDPLTWAIFAHEAGHEVHRDFDSSRASVSAENKELEADRFAGYTLEKLGIPATDLTPFWTMAGDEFGSGAGYKHGSSAQRVAAFKQGWHLAEWNRRENSKPVQSAMDEPVAPDDADAAPQ